MKPYKAGRSSGSRWPKMGLSLIIVVLVIAVAGYFGVRRLYEQNLQPVDIAATDDIVYTLETGTTPAQVAAELEVKELIRSARAFEQYVRSNKLSEDFKAGTYRLKKSMTVSEIVSILTEGRVAKDLFTILPSQSLSRIKQSFIAQGFDAAEVEQALQPEAYNGHPALVDKPAGASLEGYVYPDSYQLIKGETTPITIIGQALDEMAEALTPDIRAGLTAQGLGVYDAIKLASIVEGEVSGNKPGERPQVAQVFLSRLRIGMMLQSNATDLAAEERGESYDTYKIAGLPPEPISNVTVSALQAVANPAKSDYLFFVSGRDCQTRFSRSEAEHNALINQHGVARPEDNCS